jgi:hypothetical protein
MIETESSTKSDEDVQSEDDLEEPSGPIPLLFSEEVILDTIKEKDPGKVTHLEFIFERITQFGDLTRFSNLKQLCRRLNGTISLTF